MAYWLLVEYAEVKSDHKKRSEEKSAAAFRIIIVREKTLSDFSTMDSGVFRTAAAAQSRVPLSTAEAEVSSTHFNEQEGKRDHWRLLDIWNVPFKLNLDK